MSKRRKAQIVSPTYGAEEAKKMTTLITWSDQLGPRSRWPWLLLIQEGRVVPFTGHSIPQVVAVIGSDYTKDGKWSHTTYRLQLAPGVRYIAGVDGWETSRFAEGLAKAVGVEHIDTWTDLAEALGVSLEEAVRFLCERRPEAAERFNAVDAAMADLC